MLRDDGGNNNISSRTGTLYGAWSNSPSIPPVITDTYVDGDQVYNDLKTIIFTLVWRDNNNIDLQMDCTNVNSTDTFFNGLFTNFGNTF
jgi:hypothetical protein